MNTIVAAMRIWILAILTVFLAGCGGSGGTVVSTAPVISNLVVTPSAAYVSSTPLTFNATFDFTDVDGNLASLTLRVLDSHGVTLTLETLPIQGVEGVTADTLFGELIASAEIPDTYTVQIYVTDAIGQPSNVLSGTTRIAAFPWTSKLAGPTPREYAATAVLNGKIYVLGGQRTDSVPAPATNVVEIYDPVTNTWTPATSMPTARMGLVAVVVNGKIYAIGGRTDGTSTSAVGTVEEFDPNTNLWTTRNTMPTPRFFAAGVLAAGEIHVAGGEFEINVLNTVEAYNPLTNQWRSRTAMPTGRGRLAMAESGGYLHAVGGYAGVASQWIGTVEAYDPLAATWATRTPMPTARAHLSLVPINGKLLAAGGENVARSLDVLESYDPITNLWTTKTPSPIAFTRAAAGVVNGRMYVFGNGLTLEYDPANEIR
jgi:N-acetylneuraminic acid mutarotase